MEYLKLLEINSDKLVLHTGMNSKVFVQSNAQDKLHGKGWIASFSDSNGWVFEPYQFTNTQVVLDDSNNDEITVTGAPFKGDLFIDYLEKGSFISTKTNNKDQIFTLLEHLNDAIEASLQNDAVQLEANGPLSIIVANETKFLFLPSEIFQISLNSLSTDKISQFFGCYQNKALANTTAELHFMLSCMLYQALTGLLPYPELDKDKRVEDYYDRNFIPLNLIVPINLEDTALNIMNTNLSLQGAVHYTPKTTKKQKNKKDKSSEPSKSFPPGSILELSKSFETATNNIHDKFFNKKCQKYLKQQNKAILRKRYFRKHGTSIGIIILISIFVLSIPFTIISGNLKKPTTKNMSAIQVVQTFYDGINTINTEKIDSTGKKDAIKSYSNSISTIFVTQQMRVGYDQAQPYFTPQQWLNTAKPLEYLPFGVTNLQIDTVIEPKTEQHIKNLQTNLIETTAQIDDTAVFSSSYYYIRGNEHFDVIQKKETIYLTYFKHKFWQITKIDTNLNENIDIDDTKLQENLQDAFNQSKPSTRGFEMATILKKTYPWMPNPQAVANAKPEVLDYIEPEVR